MRYWIRKLLYEGSSGAEASEQLSSPAPLNIVPISNSVIYSSWTGIGGASYSYKRGLQSDFSDVVEVYSGTDPFFSDSGRATGTTYYYQLTASLEGYEDVVITGSAKTVSFTPEFWYEATGARQATNNDYVDADSGTVGIDSFKSIINTSGPSAAFVTTRANILAGTSTGTSNNDSAYRVAVIAAKAYNLSSAISLASNEVFTVMAKIAFVGTPLNHRLTVDLVDTTRRIQFSSLSSIGVSPAGTLRTITVPAMSLNIWYDVVIRRIAGNTLQASVDGGATFANAAATDGGAFQIGQLFGSLSILMERITVVKQTLTLAQMTEFFAYGELPAYVPAPPADSDELIDVEGITYSPYTGPYITDATLSYAATASPQRGSRMLSEGDKCGLILQKNETVDTGADRFYLYDKTGARIGYKELAAKGVNTDTHNTRSFTVTDRKFLFLQGYPHYVHTPNSFYMETSGPEYDLTEITNRVVRGGVPSGICAMSQYPNITVLTDGKILVATQGWDGTNGGFLNNFMTTDFGNSWEKVTVASTEDSDDWFYPAVPYNNVVGDWHYVFIKHLVDIGEDYNYLYMVKTQDGRTFYNMNESYSKNVTGNNYFTKAQLQANCMVFDASALPGNCQTHTVNVDENGIPHLIAGDGNGGWQLIRWNGTAWVTQVLDFGLTDVVTSDSTVIAAWATQFLHPKSTPGHYDMYFLYDPGNDLWQITKFTTTDYGATLTEDRNFMTGQDAAVRHLRIVGTQNACYTNNIAIAATCVDISNAYQGKVLFQPL
jgi:hypothetical protein